MTFSHDCEARLNMLQETIEKNRDNLLDHDVEEQDQQAAETAVNSTAK